MEPEAKNCVSLHVTSAAERQLRQGHPWLYDQAIRKQNRQGDAGDLAVVYDARNRFLALGLYDPFSPIRVRVLQRQRRRPIDASWFIERFKAAKDRRAVLFGKRDTTGFRLIHGENDGLPGLVLDKYADTLVLKLYSAGYLARLLQVQEAAAEVFGSRRLILRLSRAVKQQRIKGFADGQLLSGQPLDGAVLFEENGLLFEADPVHGHKTGFFLDQRDNRMEVSRLTRGKSVCDVFSYSGGFSVYAAAGQAESVLSIDSSPQALASACRNMALNRKRGKIKNCKHAIVEADAFAHLSELAKKKTAFDVVIIDPPAFAKAQSEVKQALRAYGHLAELGFGVLRRGGILVISSCSAHVPAEASFSAVHQAAVKIKRPLRELKRTHQPIDHPVDFAEGAYLKCLFAQESKAL